MRNKPVLTSVEIRAIAEAGLAEARNIGINVTLVVTDDAGKLLYVERMDRAKSMSIDIAIKKAMTSAISHRPTKQWEERLQSSNMLLRLDEIFPVQGGLPIMVDDECVGGVGASGGSGEQDEQICAAGIAAMKARTPINTPR